MITADANFTLEHGSKIFFNALSTYVVPTVLEDDGVVRCELKTIGVLGTVSGGFAGTHVLEFTFAEINAFMPSGADDVEKLYNICEQAVMDYLDTITENSAVTFAIV